MAVGEGHVSPQSVVARLSRLVSGHRRARTSPRCRSLAPCGSGSPTSRRASWCKGLPDVWVRLGRCCTPVPGDAIVGFVTRGQGVSRAPRRLPEREDPAARARADDRGRLGRGQAHVVRRWRSRSRRSTGRGCSPTSRPCCRDNHVNILAATSTTGRDRITRLRFTFELADIAHLSTSSAREAGRERLRRVPRRAQLGAGRPAARLARIRERAGRGRRTDRTRLPAAGRRRPRGPGRRARAARRQDRRASGSSPTTTGR